VDEPPIACTLDAEHLDERLADWQRTVAAASHREEIGGGVRLRFGWDVDVADLARLAAAELVCCRFFTFTLTLAAEGVTLDITAPAGVSVIDLLTP
jgi:hypothetical protein